MSATFCLVHGSTQGPRGWDLLSASLDKRGYRSFCVDLPVDRPDASARDYAAIIADALKGTDNAIVVGHSAAGLFLPLVPDYAKVRALVYLAAVIPSPGESFLAQVQKSPEMYLPGFVGKDPTADADLARHFLFHDCTPEVAAWALTTIRRLIAKQAIIEPCPLDVLPEVTSHYLSCTAERIINPAWWEAAARERLGVEPIRIDAGHAPHVSRPDDVADILASLANS